jgi:proline dehydrogenase
MPDIRRNFLQLTESLLARGNYPAIATHDDYLIQRVKQMASERGIARDKFEFQMLYGIRPETQRRLVEEGYRMRVYVPYGAHWLPYFYRRLRERKENVLFVARNFFKR